MTIDIEVKERRFVQHLLIYWRELAPDGVLPSRRRIREAEIGDMWRCCFTLDIGSVAAIFTHIGATHVAHYGADLTGRPASLVRPGTLLAAAVDRLGDVLARRIPITSTGTFIAPGGDPVPYRSILLPLAEDGNEVSGILGAANCRLPEFR